MGRRIFSSIGGRKMRVLVINGSPKAKNSNSYQLTKAFIKGTKWDDVETVEITHQQIGGCLGCYSCWNKTPGQCVISDDMPAILNQLVNADVVIWSFPLYYFGVPGNLKNLIDRQLPLNLPFMSNSKSGGHPSRYDLSKQKYIVVSTCGFWTNKGNYEAVEAMFDRFYGKNNYLKIFCGQGELFKINELERRTATYLNLVEKAGNEYAISKVSEETLRRLNEPLYPQKTYEKMADASWGIAADNQEPSDNSLTFTTQMATLYQPDGKERVLEFYYSDIDKTYQILLDKNGSKVISKDFKKYTSRIETPFTVWQAIARNEISGQEALFNHQYRVLGDFEIMINWDQLFGDDIQPVVSEKQRKKTNMLCLLLPWIIIWTAIAIDVRIGSIIGIISATAVPLLWLKYQAVIFEQVSLPIIAGVALATLLGGDLSIWLSLSYGAFGLIWLIGSFTKLPLTAYYSSNDYGEKKAFNNPLFIITNRILTASWGVLYLFTAFWTYGLIKIGWASYSGLINSLCPLLMGLFTKWFQKWYPAHLARGRK